MGFAQVPQVTFAAHILTLYPEMFPGPLSLSLAGRALAEGVWSCEANNIRDFAADKHKSVDDTPAGGGAGMVLRADVLARAVDWVCSSTPKSACAEPVEGLSLLAEGAEQDSPSTSSGTRVSSTRSHGQRPILAMTPRGTPITQARVREIAAGPGVVILCGRFEGFDERLFEARPHIEQVSMGDIVLSSGEMAALMLLDACIRLLPDVMGAAASGDEESFENGLLEYPHYTRPANWEGHMVPEVLRSGDHAKIAAWRQHRAEVDTRLRRPDLWERHIAARVHPASGARHEKEDEA